MYNQSIINIYQSSSSSESFNISIGIAIGALICFLLALVCYIFWSCFYWKKRREILCEKCKGKFPKDKIDIHVRNCKIKSFVDEKSEVTIVDPMYSNL